MPTDANGNEITEERLQGAVRIRSPYPPEEVLRRLEAVVLTSSWTGRLGGVGLAGVLRPREFRLGWQHSLFRNSFKPVLHASIGEQGDGTEIVGQFRMLAFVRAVLTMWFGLVAVGLVAGVAQGSRPLIELNGIMLAFGVGLLAFGRWLSRDHRVRVVEALCKAVDGTLR